MICYVLAMGKQNLGPHVVVGYGIKIFWRGLFITSPDHLERTKTISRPNKSRNTSGDQRSEKFTTDKLHVQAK